MSNPLVLSNATPRRIPKRAASNRDAGSRDAGREIQSEHERDMPRPKSVVRPWGATSSFSKHREPDSRQDQAKAPRKKKSAGVLGFLTLKEPSTSALEGFAEQERRKTANQRARVIPGVSSQKLSERVPKANSKWDGLPDPSRKQAEKDQARLSHEQSNRHPTTSANPQHNSRSDCTRSQPSRRTSGFVTKMPTIRRSTEKGRDTAVTVSELFPPGSRLQDFSSPRPPAQIHPAFRNPFPRSDSPGGLDPPTRADHDSRAPEQASPNPPPIDHISPAQLSPNRPLLSPDATVHRDVRIGLGNNAEAATITTIGMHGIPRPPGSSASEAIEQTIVRECIQEERPSVGRWPSRPKITGHVRNFSRPLETSRPAAPLPASTTLVVHDGGLIVAPVITPPRAKNMDVLPWEMFAPPAEIQTSVTAGVTTDEARKHKPFGSRLSKRWNVVRGAPETTI